MQVANRDLFVTDAVQKQYANIQALINSDLLDEAFLKHDKIANRAKYQYHRLGKLAIILVAISAIFTLAEALILNDSLSGFLPTLIAATMAGTGIILQCYLILTKQKTKWLVNRFASERIRSLKFQAYQLAFSASDADELNTLVSAFVHKQFSKLNNELNAGIAVLKNFSPRMGLEIVKAPAKPKNSNMSDMAFEAYHDLRVNYQRNFALSEVTKFQSRRRLFNSTQDMIYLGAAIFAFLSLGAKISERFGFIIDTGWIDFVAVTLFVLGATEAIMDNATLEEQSQTRYEQYSRDIDVLLSEKANLRKKLPDLVAGIERICLNELDNFCRAADRISYRF
jgi:hypothetical protein